MTPYGVPSGCYHCLLDEQPYYLAPSHLLDRPEILGPATVNPACWFSWHGPLPPSLSVRIQSTENFFSGAQIVWVEDPATLAIWPFWVGDEYIEFLSRMSPGCPLEEDLPVHVRWVLTQANVLVEPNHLGRRRREWQQQAAEYADTFQRGYVVVPDLIHPFHVGALRRYYRHRTRAGFLRVGDDQVRRRFAAHNEGVARFIHSQLVHAVGDISRAVLKPSYAYFVSYLGGAELKKHRDREQCEYSITTCIDASPEPDGESPWPIELETEDGPVPIYQRIGDALLYRGCAIAHSRARLADGHTSTSLLLHYVDESFDGPLD